MPNPLTASCQPSGSFPFILNRPIQAAKERSLCKRIFRWFFHSGMLPANISINCCSRETESYQWTKIGCWSDHKFSWFLTGKWTFYYGTNEAMVMGVEFRTSSLVRIPVDPVLPNYKTISNLFLCRKGASCTGRIVSPPVDGERVVAEITERKYFWFESCWPEFKSFRLTFIKSTGTVINQLVSVLYY